MPQARVEHDTRAVGHGRGTGGRRGLAGQRDDAPSEARGADGSRAGRHPPAHTATRHHRYGGRRRDRRARAGFEIDHSEPQARVWRSRGRPGPTAPGTPVGPQATQAGRPPPTGTHSDQAPLVWRAPEGPAAVPVGGGGAWPGFETTRRAKLAARTTRGRDAAHGHTKQPGPAGRAKRPAQQHTTRRPERQRRHKKHSTGARARRPAPLDATTQTRQLRSTCVPCRSARAARQWRRSSRSPHLRRRAGPRR